jgi:hypothetical protein
MEIFMEIELDLMVNKNRLRYVRNCVHNHFFDKG